VPGFFDTDMFNVLLPLLIVFFIYEAVQSEDTKLKIFYSILSAFSMFVFSMAWNGWIYIFFVVVLTSLIYIIACRIKKIEIKDFYLIFGIFLVVSIGLIIIFRGLQDFLYTATLPIQFIRGFEAINPWPNINVSVNELQTPLAEELMGGIGNMLLLMGIFGIFLILRILLDEKMKKKFLNKMNWFLCLLLIVWSLISLYAITNGGRFILLVVSPLIISSGIFVGILVEYLKAIKNREKLIKALSLCLVLFLVIPPIVNAYYTFEILRPNVDDQLWDASKWISYNTPTDTVVIAPLWSYNHFFTVFADRPVVGTQDTPREYWIYKAFSTSNQSLSYGIFRMLSTSGDEAYKTLNMSTNSTSKTVEILDKILGVDNQTANEILTKDYNMNEKKAQEVLKYTHPNKTRNFVLLTFDDMVDAGYWTFYFGEWDFYKMEPGGYTYSVGKITVKNNTIKSSNGVLMDLKSGNITWKNKVPYCGIIITEGKVKKIYYDENSYFCVILSMDNDKSVIINKKFENSLYTKLLFEKSNSTLFKPLYKNKKVIVWKAIDL